MSRKQLYWWYCSNEIEICIYLLPEQQKERKMNYVDKYYKLSITAGLSKKFRLASLAMFLDMTIYGLCIVKKYHFNQQYFSVGWLRELTGIIRTDVTMYCLENPQNVLNFLEKALNSIGSFLGTPWY